MDIIKILAAFAIVFHHYNQCFDVKIQFAILNRILPLLGYMVELFFLISGYFAAKTFKETKSLKWQYGRKVVRLYPYALLSVIFTAIIMLVHYNLWGECIWGNKYSTLGIITSFLMINQGWIIEFAPALNNPIWYICVLLWLYFLYYCIEFILKKFSEKNRQKVRIFIYFCIVLLGGLGWHYNISLPFLYLSDCRGYATFFGGIIIFELMKRVDRQKKYIRRISMFVAMIAFLVILINKNFNWYLWVYAICPAILICGITCRQIPFKNTKKVSEVTFQLYLWHVPCFYVFQFLLDIYGIKFTHSIYSMVITVIFCFAVSMLVYHFIALPVSQRLLKKRGN